MSRDELIDLSGADRSRCPACNAAVPIDSSDLMGNERCPNCGEMLLWLRLAPGVFSFHRYQQRDRIRERVIEIVAQQLGVDKAKIKSATVSSVTDLGADSLDTVELVMELEEEFG